MADKKPAKKFDLADESDRGAVIVGQAMLDALLADVLSDFLVRLNPDAEKDVKKAIGRGGYLSSFSRRVELAFILKVITKEMRDDFEKIRSLRNRFAHTSEEIDFLDKSIGQIVESLHCVQEFRTTPRMKRYSLRSPKKLPDHEVRSLGYLKYHKAIFCLGIGNLKIFLLKRLVGHKVQGLLKASDL